jgi:hypothetical protein
MKKFLIVAVIACAAAGSAFAGWGGPGQGPSSHGLPEAGDPVSDLSAVTISGVLAIVNGSLAVQDGYNVYHIKSLSRLMRTVPGLVIGARVTLTGDTSKMTARLAGIISRRSRSPLTARPTRSLTKGGGHEKKFCSGPCAGVILGLRPCPFGL